MNNNSVAVTIEWLVSGNSERGEKVRSRLTVGDSSVIGLDQHACICKENLTQIDSMCVHLLT